MRAWLRKKLREIEYYSANRPRNAWTRAGDLALIAALLLALPATYILDNVFMREEIIAEVNVLIARQHPAAADPEALYAWIATPEHNRFLATDGVSVGEASVVVSTMRHGWPVTTSVDQAPAEIVLQLYDQTATLTNDRIPADSPYRTAIMDALGRAEQFEAIASIGAGESRHIVLLAWIASAVLWWWILSIVLGSTVAILHFFWNIYRQKLSIRRRRRRLDNKCEECGYDLTGLEFNERCPECGSFIY